MESPFEAYIYDPQFAFLQELPAVESMSLTPRFNAQGTGEFIVAADADVNKHLLVPGARLVVRYRGEHLISGVIRNPVGSLSPSGSITYQLQDDWRLFANTQARVRPDRPASADVLTEIGQAWQTGPAGATGTVTGQTGYYRWPADVSTAEGAIKHLLEVNLVSRLGRPVVIAPNQDRGGNARAAGLLRNDAIRNDYLDEVLGPILTWSGLGLRAYQTPGDRHITIDVWEPGHWPHPLTLESGVVVDGEWSRTDAEGTRDLVGGPGEDAARAFHELALPSLEAELNDVIEIFTDATSGAPSWPDAVAEDLRVMKYYSARPEVPAADRTAFRSSLARAAIDALAEVGRTAGVSAELAETPSFHFGGADGIHLGDLLQIEAAGQTFSDRLGSATLTLADDGFSVTPQLGSGPVNEDEEVWRAVASLADAIRTLATRR